MELAKKWKEEARALRDDRDALNALSEIREAGWAVAVHNDYRQDGKLMTFWLFTKDGRCVKGEGETDADALNVIRKALRPARGDEND